MSSKVPTPAGGVERTFCAPPATSPSLGRAFTGVTGGTAETGW